MEGSANDRPRPAQSGPVGRIPGLAMMATRHYLVLVGEPTYEGYLIGPGSSAPPGFHEAVDEDFEDEDRYGKERNLSARDGLEDVGSWNTLYINLIIVAAGRFFAKVSLILDDELHAVRVMYLYCAGWRRREGLRGTNPRSAEIVWALGARFARDFYGPTARLFVIMPREGVYSALEAQNARQWTLAKKSGYGGLISSVLDRPLSRRSGDWEDCAAELSVQRLHTLC
jgi:hypothetical protein